MADQTDGHDLTLANDACRRCPIGVEDANLDLDPALVDEAVAVGGRRTKKETVTEALREYIARRRQVQIASLFGTVDYDPSYDYKKRRRRT